MIFLWNIFYLFFYFKRYGETPLHLATRAGFLTVVRKLIEAKADYTIVGSHGTPYDVARNSHNPEVARLFESNYYF